MYLYIIYIHTAHILDCPESQAQKMLIPADLVARQSYSTTKQNVTILQCRILNHPIMYLTSFQKQTVCGHGIQNGLFDSNKSFISSCMDSHIQTVHMVTILHMVTIQAPFTVSSTLGNRYKPFMFLTHACRLPGI